jgi:hypothetical protein
MRTGGDPGRVAPTNAARALAQRNAPTHSLPAAVAASLSDGAWFRIFATVVAPSQSWGRTPRQVNGTGVRPASGSGTSFRLRAARGTARPGVRSRRPWFRGSPAMPFPALVPAPSQKCCAAARAGYAPSPCRRALRRGAPARCGDKLIVDVVGHGFSPCTTTPHQVRHTSKGKMR